MKVKLNSVKNAPNGSYFISEKCPMAGCENDSSCEDHVYRISSTAKNVDLELNINVSDEEVCLHIPLFQADPKIGQLPLGHERIPLNDYRKLCQSKVAWNDIRTCHANHTADVTGCGVVRHNHPSKKVRPPIINHEALAKEKEDHYTPFQDAIRAFFGLTPERGEPGDFWSYPKSKPIPTYWGSLTYQQDWWVI